MKQISLDEMELINAGSFFSSFCKGFAAGSVVYQVGVYANLWNPVGQTAGVAILLVNGACLFS